MANEEPLLGEGTAYMEVGPDDEPPQSDGGGLRHRRQSIADANVDKNFFAWVCVMSL
jgi:hypothetical protein